MKTANRARRNAGKNTPSAQSATAPKIKPGKTLQIESGEYSKPKVSIVAEIPGHTLQPFPLSDALTAAMLQRVNSEGYRDIGTAIDRALHQNIVAMKRGHFPSVEFESVLNRTLALLHLLESKLQNDLTDKVGLRSPEYNPLESSRAAGYQEMFHYAQNDLRKIFDDVFRWLQAADAPESVAPRPS